MVCGAAIQSWTAPDPEVSIRRASRVAVSGLRSGFGVTEFRAPDIWDGRFMRNARAWLWGLIPLVVIWALANLTTGLAVKNDLTTRTNEQMAQRGQPWARADFSCRDARIVSAAPSPVAKISAIDAAADTRGVRRVSGEGDVLPPRNPYTWSAQRAAAGVTLQGYAPDDGARQQMRVFRGLRRAGRWRRVKG